MCKEILIFTVFAGFILMTTPLQTFASSSADSLPVIQDSKAYQQFKKRPVNNHSKIIYLIERLETLTFEVDYGGFYYKAPLAAVIAKFFILTHYKKETVPVWITLWCHRAVDGKLIYVRYPDGKFALSSEVLTNEWKSLEAILAQEAVTTDLAAQDQKRILGVAPKSSVVFS